MTPLPIQGSIYIDNINIIIDVNAPWSSSISGKADFSINGDNQILYKDKIIYLNGVAVLSTDNTIESAKYSTLQTLAGTKWVINDYVDLSGDITYNVNFSSYGSDYSEIYLNGSLGKIKYDNSNINKVYDADMTGWVDQGYRIIEITDGTDATNADLISWLQANGVLVAVTDLTNTSWYIKNTNCAAEYGQFYIGFTIGGSSYDMMFIGYYVDSLTEERENTISIDYNGTQLNSGDIIAITGGDDAANASLIAWLTEHAMQVPTDLTGTKWILKSNLGTTTPAGTEYSYGIEHSFNEPYSLNFTSNSNNYTQFCFNGLGEGGDTVLIYNSTYVNNGLSSNGGAATWANDAYRMIEVTGGTDAVNINLIAWLMQNATQVLVTDLTGTKWVINSNLPHSSDVCTTGVINFISNSVVYSEFDAVMLEDGLIYYEDNSQDVSDKVYEYGWLNEAYRNIEITGGEDVTSTELILWFTENAELQVEPQGNVYEITHSLTNLSHGDISFTIVPDAGYELPASSADITITNGTLVSYDSSTGVVVISGDDNTSVSFVNPAITPFNNIHIKATNDLESEYDVSCRYSLDGGDTWVIPTDRNEVILNNVTSLIVDVGAPDASYVALDTSRYWSYHEDPNNADIYSSYNPGEMNITSKLQDSCYVSLVAHW